MTTIRHFANVTAVINDQAKTIELRPAPARRQPLGDRAKKWAVTWAKNRLAAAYPGYTINDQAVQA